MFCDIHHRFVQVLRQQQRDIKTTVIFGVSSSCLKLETLWHENQRSNKSVRKWRNAFKKSNSETDNKGKSYIASQLGFNFESSYRNRGVRSLAASGWGSRLTSPLFSPSHFQFSTITQGPDGAGAAYMPVGGEQRSLRTFSVPFQNSGAGDDIRRHLARIEPLKASVNGAGQRRPSSPLLPASLPSSSSPAKQN